MIQFSVNGKAVSTAVPGDKPLLWVLREDLAMTGTKFGCGIAQCGACTVHLDGAPVRACSTPVSVAAGKAVTTVEGLAQTREGKALRSAAGTLDLVLSTVFAPADWRGLLGTLRPNGVLCLVGKVRQGGG